jgi:nickel-dependent lactate racemase
MTLTNPFPFGKQQLTFQVSEANLVRVLGPHPVPACPDPIAEIQRALDHPLGTPPIEQIVISGEKILILLDDHTRDTPVKLLLQQLLERLTKVLRDQRSRYIPARICRHPPAVQ